MFNLELSKLGILLAAGRCEVLLDGNRMLMMIFIDQFFSALVNLYKQNIREKVEIDSLVHKEKLSVFMATGYLHHLILNS